MKVLELLDIDIKKSRVISVVGGGGKTSLIFQMAEELVAFEKKVIVTTTTHMAYEQGRPFVGDGNLRKIRENIRKFGYTVVGVIEEKKNSGYLSQTGTDGRVSWKGHLRKSDRRGCS